MKINIKVITFVLVAVLAVLYSPTVASAAENSGVYYLKYTQMSTNDNFANQLATWDYSEIHSDVPLYMYLTDLSAGSSHAEGTKVYNLVGVDESAEYLEVRYLYSVGAFSRSDVVTSLTGSNRVSARFSPRQTIINSLSSGDVGIQIYMLTYETDIPIFDSRGSLLDYLQTGNDSGQLNKPQVDYSIKHNFANDVYTTDIPVPEISNITYNGFVVDNIGDYYIDVLVDSKFCGVKHVERLNGVTMNSKTWDIAPDNVWTYNKHYYNLSSDVLDCAYSDSHVNISQMYGVDIVADFVSDFVTWSKEYPSVKDLPDYSWLKMGLASTSYPNKHIYEADSEMTDYMQIMESGQAVVTYYVRFYDSNGRNGRWASYTYQSGYDTIDNGMVGLGTLSSGVIDVNTNGDIYIKDSAVGQVDDSGSITYGSAIDTVDIDSGMAGFMNVMLLFEDAIGSVSGFVASIFGFLPWWATSILGLGLTVVVILRIAGR